MLNGKTVVLGISACGNAWQTPLLVQELIRRNANVEVILTAAATNFVTELSLRNITHRPVLVDAFAEPKAWDQSHKPLAQRCDLLLIAPASANLIAKAAQGIADDLLTTTLLSVKSPVLLVPQISEAMCAKPATRRNLTQVKEDGLTILGENLFTRTGFFAFPSISEIVDSAEQII